VPSLRPRRGEIWFVHTPGRPDDPHQPRPALVVSADVRNALRDHVIVVPAFSTGRPGPTRVVLPAGVGGLDHHSVLFCDEVTTLHHGFLSERPAGPPVPGRVLKEVVRAIRRALGDVVPEPEQAHAGPE